MMKTSNEAALTKLQNALDALNSQSVSELPPTQVASLEKAKSALYGEIQALQVQEMDERDSEYNVLTTDFQGSKSDLTDLSDWIAQRRNRDRALFTILSKGVSIALSLLA